MLVNINNIVKKGYKLSDYVLYKGNKYQIVAIDFRWNVVDAKIFLLNGYNQIFPDINVEKDNQSFVLYDSDETLTRKYSLWVSYNQISKVEDEVKNDYEKYGYNPSDFTNIDDKESFEILFSIKEDMCCGNLDCSKCPLEYTTEECALSLRREDAKEHLDAIIEMYKTYHSRRNKEDIMKEITNVLGYEVGKNVLVLQYDKTIAEELYEDYLSFIKAFDRSEDDVVILESDCDGFYIYTPYSKDLSIALSDYVLDRTYSKKEFVSIFEEQEFLNCYAMEFISETKSFENINWNKMRIKKDYVKKIGDKIFFIQTSNRKFC